MASAPNAEIPCSIVKADIAHNAAQHLHIGRILAVLYPAADQFAQNAAEIFVAGVAQETTREDSDPEQAAMAFICKRLKLNYGKLSEEEKKWLKKIAQKSDLLKNPKPQRGRK